jgi:hypothetical protein
MIRRAQAPFKQTVCCLDREVRRLLEGHAAGHSVNEQLRGEVFPMLALESSAVINQQLYKICWGSTEFAAESRATRSQNIIARRLLPTRCN